MTGIVWALFVLAALFFGLAVVAMLAWWDAEPGDNALYTGPEDDPAWGGGE